jgi:hypothetical protein
MTKKQKRPPSSPDPSMTPDEWAAYTFAIRKGAANREANRERMAEREAHKQAEIADLEKQRDRLIGALALLASPNAGERDAAALAVERIRASMGLEWEKLIAQAFEIKFHKPFDLKSAIDSLNL